MIAFELSGETLTALAAFLSGIGTVLTGFLALRYEQKRSREDCEKRFEAFREGFKLGRNLREDKDEGGKV